MDSDAARHLPAEAVLRRRHHSADGEEVAWDRVRIKLQEIIDNEDKTKPLSDDAIVEELGKAGITVARRTVTKYRKAMNIPSSRGRRDWTQGREVARHRAQRAGGLIRPESFFQPTNLEVVKFADLLRRLIR